MICALGISLCLDLREYIDYKQAAKRIAKLRLTASCDSVNCFGRQFGCGYVPGDIDIVLPSDDSEDRSVSDTSVSFGIRDSEQMFVNAEACRIVNEAKDRGNKICAIGTTVMRAIETAVGTDGHLKEFEGWTNKFIFPPYDFSVANAMVSNFHMPLSTMLMLVCAYGGYELIMDAYNIALKEDYRFGTYGDAMLILDK